MVGKGKNKVLPCGLALRQEQCGCSRFRSFPYSFWSLCFSFSAAASSFVQDSIKTCQKKGWFPRIIVLQIFLIQPGVPNDNPNDNETITKNRIIPCWIWMIWVRSDKNDECLEAPRVFRMRASQAGHLIPKLHPFAPPKCSWKDWPMMRVDIIKHFGMFLGYHRWFLAELECNSGMCAPIPFTPVLCWAGSCNFITQCAAGGMLRWGACRNTWCQHWFHNRHL